MGGGAQRPPSQHTQSKAEQNQSRVLLTVQRLRIKQTRKKNIQETNNVIFTE